MECADGRRGPFAASVSMWRVTAQAGIDRRLAQGASRAPRNYCTRAPRQTDGRSRVWRPRESARTRPDEIGRVVTATAFAFLEPRRRSVKRQAVLPIQIA